MTETRQKNGGLSKTRKTYIMRLIGRIIILFICFYIYFFRPEELSVLKGWEFFRKFSLLHILWIIWMCDMLFQLIPFKKVVALGSRKHFKEFFRPIHGKINTESLHRYIVSTTKAAYKVFLIWAVLLICLGVLYGKNIINDEIIFMVSVVFYVCDLICVLIWCPFRLIMKNKCCTTCRIFNWDHLMMFTPMMFVKGFFSLSLLIMSIVVWAVWELRVITHPERFWEKSNASLTCSACVDKLCIQYCQKLRK